MAEDYLKVRNRVQSLSSARSWQSSYYSLALSVLAWDSVQLKRLPGNFLNVLEFISVVGYTIAIFHNYIGYTTKTRTRIILAPYLLDVWKLMPSGLCGYTALALGIVASTALVLILSVCVPQTGGWLDLTQSLDLALVSVARFLLI